MGFFTRWLSGLFGSEATEKIESEIGGGKDPDMLALKMLAIQTAVGYIAAAVGQCDFRTFQKSEEFKGKEHFLWNYSPNPNQNSRWPTASMPNVGEVTDDTTMPT